ncbi:MAG: hypothetical protein CMJ31_01475 [Phycisphaerae bacterium]|nr:hypothetical protein [Phycisphaerae bacterium]
MTGDLVNSSRLTAAELARARRVVERVGVRLRRGVDDGEAERVEVGVDWYRGDGWELSVRPGVYALRAALLVRATLRGVMDELDTRIAIGVGAGDPDDREAFIRSGRRFEALGRDEWFAIEGAGSGWDAAAGVIDETIRSRWTGKRAFAVMAALRGVTQERTGRLYRPRVTQATVGEHLDRAGWSGVKRAVGLFEAERSQSEGERR